MTDRQTDNKPKRKNELILIPDWGKSYTGKKIKQISKFSTFDERHVILGTQSSHIYEQTHKSWIQHICTIMRTHIIRYHFYAVKMTLLFQNTVFSGLPPSEMWAMPYLKKWLFPQRILSPWCSWMGLKTEDPLTNVLWERGQHEWDDHTLCFHHLILQWLIFLKLNLLLVKLNICSCISTLTSNAEDIKYYFTAFKVLSII